MGSGNSVGDSSRDGWWYTAELGGEYRTRHEAVGAAAVSARVMLEARGEGHGPTPLEATQRVYAYKPHRCGYCGATFLTMEERHEKHMPCPHYVEAVES